MWVVFILYYCRPCSGADRQRHGPVVQTVTSDIPVPEVMKLIWWSVVNMANKQSLYWSRSTGSCAPLCAALFCIAKDRELLPQSANVTQSLGTFVMLRCACLGVDVTSEC